MTMKKNALNTTITRRSLVGSAAAGAGVVAMSAVTSLAGAEEAAQPFEFGIDWDAEYDVIVVGFGGAGANSAIAAADAGAKVLLLEKAPEAHAGGNSWACAQLLCYTVDAEATKTYVKGMRGAYETPSDEMIEVYCDEMAKNLDWVTYLGADDPQLVPVCEWPHLEGSDSFRFLTVHATTVDSGAYNLFKNAVIERADSIDVWYEAPAKKLVQDPDTKIIHGVVVEVDGTEVCVRAKNGVVLACGGFENDEYYQEQYLARRGWHTLGNAIYNTGDGIRMALDVNADLWHMGQLAANNFEAMDPESGRVSFKFGGGVRGIIVGSNGRRFINEAFTGEGKHGVTDNGGMYHTPIVPDDTFEILDQAMLDGGPLFETWSPDSSVEVEKGWIFKADTLADLAAQLGFTEEAAANLDVTVQSYNEFCENGLDLAFYKNPEKLVPIATPPFYAVRLVHCIANTQGGPVRDVNGQILDAFGEPIPHLYEAGELGDIWANLYQASCNLGGGMIFGRISGRNAAAPKDDVSQESALAKEPFAPAPKEPELAQYEAGEGELIGQAQGKHGRIVVKVTLDGDAIAGVEVLEQDENPVFASYALAKIPADIVAAGSADVDVVAGATFTSVGVMNAVRDALEQA